jgi:O-antigen ligase
VDSLVQRIATFGNLQSDDSYADRQLQTRTAFSTALREPIGYGLGTVGTATKLGGRGNSTVLDNGYLARFVEMGFVGSIFYLVAIVAGLAMSLSAWSASRRDPEAGSLLAACFAVQLATAALDISSDFHSALSGMLFWLAMGVPALYGLSRRTWNVQSVRPVAAPVGA